MADQQELAETLALNALAWLAGQDELLGVFLGSSGLAQSELAERAKEPEFLGAVLDFLLMDDAWIVAFADAHAVPYDQVMRARQALPGGASVHWT